MTDVFLYVLGNYNYRINITDRMLVLFLCTKDVARKFKNDTHSAYIIIIS